MTHLPGTASERRGISYGGFVAFLLILLAGCSATNRLPGWMNFSSGHSVTGVPIAWEHSHRQAVSAAASTNKVMMLWFTGSDWCKYCTMLEDEVLHTGEFNDWYVDKIVPVMLDYPRHTEQAPDQEEQNAALMKKYSDQVTSFPTALFVDTNGKVLGKLGYARGGPGPWIEQAEEILARSAGTRVY